MTIDIHIRQYRKILRGIKFQNDQFTYKPERSKGEFYVERFEDLSGRTVAGESTVVTVTRRCVQLHKVHLDPADPASVAACIRVRIEIKQLISLTDLSR